MPDALITIRPCSAFEDYQACQEAQRRAWGLVDESYVVPIATLVGAQHHGGLVLGAFLPDNQAVGVSFAFLGRSKQRWCLYSQLTGVTPGYQGQGIGLRIKEYQRDYARSIGLDFIAWAFDPLQAGNAYFNLHRLGASCHRYLENMYGLRTDALNLAVPTDRLIAEWPTSPAALNEEASLQEEWPMLVEGPDEPKQTSLALVQGKPVVLIEIPPAIQALRAAKPSLADRWRQAVASAFQEAFADGLRACDVLRSQGRVFYKLAR